MVKISDNLSNIIVVFLVILLFLGGLGFESESFYLLSTLSVCFLLLLSWLSADRLNLPRRFLIYLGFLLLLLISALWSQDTKISLMLTSLFVNAGVIWVIVFNLSKKHDNKFQTALVFLGVLFGFLTFFEPLIKGETLHRGVVSLVLRFTEYHHHIGDYWAIVLLIAAYIVARFKDRRYLVLIPAGFYFLYLSLSRSAYISLIAGLIILFSRGLSKKVNKASLYIALVVVIALFLFAGAHKTILFTRLYYLQGVCGLLRHPLGVGLGRFGIVSMECKGVFGTEPSLSIFAFNILLEILAAIGIFGLIFLTWLSLIMKDMIDIKSEKSVLYQSLFFAILVNFMFDTTYFIPTMLWVWFVIIAIIQKNALEKRVRK